LGHPYLWCLKAVQTGSEDAGGRPFQENPCQLSFYHVVDIYRRYISRTDPVAAWDSSKLGRSTQTGVTIDCLQQLHMRGQYNTVAEIGGRLIADGHKRMTRGLALHLHHNGFSKPLGEVVPPAQAFPNGIEDVRPAGCARWQCVRPNPSSGRQELLHRHAGWLLRSGAGT
jgi:hypothetical protein